MTEEERRERKRAYNREYYAKNRERENARCRKHYSENRRAYNREYYQQNRERTYTRTKEWKKQNPEKVKLARKRHHLKHRYNITSTEYEAMLSAQEGVCAICKQPPGANETLAVDHCHNSGKVRALLCRQCNLCVGAIENNRALLLVIRDYLRTHGSIS